MTLDTTYHIIPDFDSPFFNMIESKKSGGIKNISISFDVNESRLYSKELKEISAIFKKISLKSQKFNNPKTKNK